MQWYEENPKLYQIEKGLMNQHFPEAKEIKLSNADLAWQVKINISKTDDFKPWTFLLVYKSDFAKSSGEDSIRVIPLSPSYEELQKRFRDTMKERSITGSNIPHCTRVAGGTTFLSVRTPENDGEVPSAVGYAAAAAEWALYFELSMRDNHMWNKWVNNDYYDSEG